MLTTLVWALRPHRDALVACLVVIRVDVLRQLSRSRGHTWLWELPSTAAFLRPAVKFVRHQKWKWHPQPLGAGAGHVIRDRTPCSPRPLEGPSLRLSSFPSREEELVFMSDGATQTSSWPRCAQG